MKKIISIILVFAVLSFTLCGCGYEYKELNIRGTYTREFEGTEITVYNWG